LSTSRAKRRQSLGESRDAEKPDPNNLLASSTKCPREQKACLRVVEMAGFASPVPSLFSSEFRKKSSLVFKRTTDLEFLRSLFQKGSRRLRIFKPEENRRLL
jgi:hypothetical protein